MEFIQLIISFLVLMFVVCGVIIFFLRRALITSTEGAVNRLNEEIAKANNKQAELNIKLKEADEELERRKKEAKELADKMRADAEGESKAEREKIVNKAREEGEEIIAKAQNAKEKIRKELEKEAELKTVNNSIKILNSILSEKAKGAFNEILISEYIESLKNTDMSKLSMDIKEVEVITVNPLDDTKKKQLSEILKDKLGREVAVNAKADANVAGGVLLKFGSMALDGTVKNLIREAAVDLQEEVEAKSGV